jgi:hypothetical protein
MSAYVPRDANELYTHDRRVKKNWLALKDGTAEAGGPLAVQYHNLVSKGKMRLLGNAAGNVGLPMPDKKLLGAGEEEKPEVRKVGKFEAIVKDYIEQKKNPETKNVLNPGEKVESDIVGQTEAIKKLLQSFLPSDKRKHIVSHGSMFRYLQEKPSNRPEKQLDTDIEKPHQKKPRGKVHEFKHEIGTEAGRAHLQNNNERSHVVHEVCEMGMDKSESSETWLDNREEIPKRTFRRQARTFEEFQMENSEEFTSVGENFVADDSFVNIDSDAVVTKERKRGGRTLQRIRGRGTRVRLSDINSDEILKYQMEGTKKLGGQTLTNQNGEITSLNSEIHGEELEKLKEAKTVQDQVAKGSFHQPNTSVRSRLDYERRNRQLNEPEPYLYSDETGYQHPYGKVDNALNSVDISEKMKKPGRIFKKGNVYYDENGEFLYRTP